MTGQQRGRTLFICAALVALVFAVFSPALRNGFVNYDDNVYVYQNPVVMGGITVSSLGWIFTHADASVYHPLTILSLMVDYQLHGLRANWFHLTNILLHAASAVALFLVLRRMTGREWAAAAVAALFAAHPLRVESVAWVAERKDVLSAFFFILTLAAYVHYAAAPQSKWRYAAVIGVFALALLSKPTVVTLPFVLLLLDYWPLRRNEPVRRLILEKLPMVAMAAVISATTILAAHQGVSARAHVPMTSRLANAVASTVVYLRQTLWPANLAPYYPQPRDGYSAATVAALILLLTWMTAAAVYWRKSRPWLAAGWFWYLIMLTPMIGIIQVGSFAHADRMTYLPQIGICLTVVWAAAEFVPVIILAPAVVAVVALLGAGARAQTGWWQDSETLWRRDLACVSDNEVARNNLGQALLAKDQFNGAIADFKDALALNPGYVPAMNDLGLALYRSGQPAQAIPWFEAALRLNPGEVDAVNNLGLADFQLGRVEQAMDDYETALRLDPNNADAHNNLGNALLKLGRVGDAIAQFQQSLRTDPNNGEVENNLASALRHAGRVEEAIGHYRRATALAPDNESVHFNLARALLQAGDPAGAIAEYHRTLQLLPNDAEAANNLAWLLATSRDDLLRNGAEAVQLAQRADQLTGGTNPVVLGTLAAALAEHREFDKAAQTAARAASLAGQPGLAKTLNGQHSLYQSGHPFRQ